MGLSLDINLSELSIPQQQFEQLARVDASPLMAEIGDFLLSEVLLNFEKEQTPEGEAWAPSQRAQRQGGKTLTDRGHLRDSYTYSASSGSVEVGSNSIYAAIHHFGGEAGRNLAVELPARPALGITDELESDIGDMALDFYNAAFTGGLQ